MRLILRVMNWKVQETNKHFGHLLVEAFGEPYTHLCAQIIHVEFQRHGILALDFTVKFDGFFSLLPKNFRYAAETRIAGLLGPLNQDMLARQDVSLLPCRSPRAFATMSDHTMTVEEARSHYNFLLTLCIRKAESFGPMAFAFIKDHNLSTLGLTPEEQFNLFIAVAEAISDEPKRYSHKMECFQKAVEILPKTRFFEPHLLQQIQQEMQRLKAEGDLYAAAMKPERSGLEAKIAGPRIIIETDMPDYFLSIAQQRAAAY